MGGCCSSEGNNQEIEKHLVDGFDLCRRKFFDKAKRSFKLALEWDDQCLEAYLGLYLVAEDNDDFVQAKEILVRARTNTSAKIIDFYIELYKDNGDFMAIINSEPSTIYDCLAIALSYHAMDNYSEAKKVFAEILTEQNLKSIPNYLVPWFCYLQSQILDRNGDFEESYISALDGYRLSRLKYIDALVQMAYIKEKDSYEASIAYLSEAIKVNPRDVSTLEIKADIAYRNGHYNESITALDFVIETCSKVNSVNSDIYYKKATALMRLNEYADALKNYDQALAVACSNMFYYYNRGVAHFMLGSAEQAQKDFADGYALYRGYDKQDYGDLPRLLCELVTYGSSSSLELQESRKRTLLDNIDINTRNVNTEVTRIKKLLENLQLYAVPVGEDSNYVYDSAPCDVLGEEGE